MSNARRWLGVVVLGLLPGCYSGLPSSPETNGDPSMGASGGPAGNEGSGGLGDGLGDGSADGSADGSGEGSVDGGSGDTGVPGEDGICGDGVVQDDEQCDQGPANADEAACKTDCTDNVCGDGFVGPGEGCDDGNLDDGDACTSECALPSCGDGVVDPGEECDDGQNGDDDDGCTDLCLLPACGDGIEQPGAGEECDLGPANADTAACTSTCEDAACGDGLVWAGNEECDDGAGNGPNDACTPECTNNVCGDGYPGPGEACDDGNGSNMDACTNACQDAACGDGYTQPGEQCDDGNGNDNDTCSNTCQMQAGNGFPNNAYCNQVAGWDPSWTAWELEVLSLVNDARSTPTNCGSEGNFGATGPLAYEGSLTCAARNHSQDMGDNGFFSHTNPMGEGPGARLGHAQYSWSTWGENIAAGQGSPASVVNGWLASDGHCANIMNPAFTELGVGYYNAPGSMYTHYWTQNFGSP
ncbi:MAG: DUF4215 domain-containing protein [Myxococcota bacterium]